MSDETKLGTVPKGDEGRDAVHIAIIPIQADENIAGRFVKLNANGKAVSSNFNSALGVVDPFREHSVSKGSWFWLCLFPKTIKGLRHVWEHPGFESEPVQKPTVQTTKHHSEWWLKNYVKTHCYYWENEPDYGYSQFLDYVIRKRQIFYYGSDCHNLEDVHDADELFHHLSVVLGQKITASYFEAFTCSC